MRDDATDPARPGEAPFRTGEVRRQSGLYRRAIDQLLEFYCEWKEECVGVQTAYDRLSGALASDRGLAFAAYAAALDREAAAAQMYLDQVRRLSSQIVSQSDAGAPSVVPV
jgi:hypothetical protein